jgi:hypothetical protein
MKDKFRAPIKAKALSGDSAWYYRNDRSIEVYIQSDKGSAILAAKISRAQLKRWIEDTEPSK